MYRTVFWTLWEKARVGCIKKTASKHVYYLGWNRSPAQVGCMIQALWPGALGRPRGIGMGNTCKSMADSFQCMTKPTTIKKKKKNRRGMLSPNFSWSFRFKMSVISINTTQPIALLMNSIYTTQYSQNSLFFNEMFKVTN